MNNALVKFQQELTNIPPPGGNGCHSKLLGIANLGVIAGLDAQTIHDRLREHIPQVKGESPILRLTMLSKEP